MPANEGIITSYFKKQEISQKTGQLFFNIVQVNNRSDEAVRIKPLFILPDNWTQFSPLLEDTLIAPHDSIFLSMRARISSTATAEDTFHVFFRAYNMKNRLVSECSFIVNPEPFHNWSYNLDRDRLFFSPSNNSTNISMAISNKGNLHEDIHVTVFPDKNIRLLDEAAWRDGVRVTLPPFHDTVVDIPVAYIANEDRVFDMGRVRVNAESDSIQQRRFVMMEKYSDIYSPLFIDRYLPHLVELGFRTFSSNTKILPFLKARGYAKFKKEQTFTYNFNFYALTGNEDILGNTYYNFLYQWRNLKVGLGAFSSQLGRNLYTRNGIMVSNLIELSPTFSLEAFISQSLFVPKTSAAVGYHFGNKKFPFDGSFAYDRDQDKGINTATGLFRTGNINLFKRQYISFVLYGYYEDHYNRNPYTLAGVAYDLNYFGAFGKSFTIQLINNYGSPNMPGTQMGLFVNTLNLTYAIENRIRYFSMQYVYGTRNYYTFSSDGTRLPDNKLYDQYVNVHFHSNQNKNHTWEAGPSFEFYHSIRPSQYDGFFQDYTATKIRIEYKSNLYRISLNMKAGISDITFKELDTLYVRRYDFHLLGGYNFLEDYSVNFTYDYGPMVNNGLYQYAGDALNHSMSIGPSMNSTYFNGRVNLSVFANLIYRFDLNHASVNINPKVETYLARDWYFVVSGTYHYSRQKLDESYEATKSYAYAEVSIRKLWGKSEFNRWQKDTRKLKIIYFKDDNSNGIKDYGEQGVPYVKTRVRLTNSASPNVSTEFPVDVVLLSNEEGVVTFNRLPVGFYELTVMSLGDVKEYFYVDRGAEKLELTKVSVYYIPFQKASKLTGTITMKRSQFIKQGDENLSLENIRITAYNKTGNSYSSLTLADGSFTIFVPGESEYYVRMPNVFGDKFKILKNDILVYVSDTSTSSVAFNVTEVSRQIAFKKAKPQEPDTTAQPTKIKVLHGKMYENPAYDTVDVNAPPQFNLQVAPPKEELMKPGNYYAVAADIMGKTDAVNLYRILDENGIKCHLGLDEPSGNYYVYTKYYDTEKDAKNEVERLKLAGVRDALVLYYTRQ